MYNKYILSYQEIGDKMQIMMNLGDYVSRDRKVNNFIKKVI